MCDLLALTLYRKLISFFQLGNGLQMATNVVNIVQSIP